MYLFCERIPVAGAVLTQAALAIPAKATGAELQADTASIRYTMDNSTVPAAGGPGMLLNTTDPPKTFLIEDLKRIKFTQGSGAAGLNIHYFAGRDI